jgi:hypothetical protein
MYWLKSPTLPVRACVGAGSAAVARPDVAAAASRPAIAVFLIIDFPFCFSEKYAPGRFSTDRAKRKIVTAQQFETQVLYCGTLCAPL